MSGDGVARDTDVDDLARDGAMYLTPAEHDALLLLRRVQSIVTGCVIADGPLAQHDEIAVAEKVADLARMVLAQAAARAYPQHYRLLGRYAAPTPLDVASPYRSG